MRRAEVSTAGVCHDRILDEFIDRDVDDDVIDVEFIIEQRPQLD